MTTKQPERLTEGEDTISGLLKRLGLPLHLAAHEQIVRCHDVNVMEEYCAGGWHMADRDMGAGRRQQVCVRRCPAALRQDSKDRVASDLRALDGELQRCGFRTLTPSDRRPVSKVLRGILDGSRQVEGLSALLATVDRYLSKPIDRNIILHGGPGTGKTTAQLCLHFAALENGQCSRYVTSGDLRKIAIGRGSAVEDLRVEADQQLNRLKSAQVLVWTDIGSEKSLVRNFTETLQDLFDGMRGVVVGSTNRTSEQLAEDESNYGPRISSRLFGDHNGNDCVLIKLEGSDQRQYVGQKRRSQFRSYRGGRQHGEGE